MLDRNLAENISRVLYPNDNVSQAFCKSGMPVMSGTGLPCRVMPCEPFPVCPVSNSLLSPAVL